MNLRASGKRNKLGSLNGPMNHASLNGTRPAMLAAQSCNSDVQLPYRFPRVAETHSCPNEKCLQNNDDAIIETAQVPQDAQAGYACDYCTKRQPMAFNEVKECCKGHHTMSDKIAKESVNDIGKRQATRLMSNAYNKGIVRGQVENTNLRA